MQQNSFRSFLLRLFFVMLAALLVIYVDKTLLLARAASGFLLPILLGAAIAFVLSIPLSWIEKIWFPKTTNKYLILLRRPVCMALVFVLLGVVLYALWQLIIPNFLDALSMLASVVPEYAEHLKAYVLQHAELFPELAEWVENLEINWVRVTDSVMQYLLDGPSETVLSSTASLIGGVFGGVIDFILAIIYTLYFLAGKEAIWRGIRRRMDAYLSEGHVAFAVHAADCAHHTFRSYILGQFTEAIVLGSLCAIGMVIFRFPFPTLVSVFVGVTAIIPLVGAYLGAIFGALMIFTVDPLSALWFLVFLIILQQIEGNLIYPRVVGNNLNLPGIWVLIAVTVGGGIGGIPGIMLGVPLVALAHHLIREDVEARLSAKQEPPAPERPQKPKKRAGKKA